MAPDVASSDGRRYSPKPMPPASSIVVNVGDVPVALTTSDGALLAMLEQRFHRFLNRSRPTGLRVRHHCRARRESGRRRRPGGISGARSVAPAPRRLSGGVEPGHQARLDTADAVALRRRLRAANRAHAAAVASSRVSCSTPRASSVAAAPFSSRAHRAPAKRQSCGMRQKT